MRFALKFEVRSNFRKLNYIKLANIIKLEQKKESKKKKKGCDEKMAQAEKRNTSNNNHILIQLQAPEVVIPQVLVKEAPLEKPKSQSIEKRLRKVFNKFKYNARISEEIVSINNYKGQVDAKLLGTRNSTQNF